jgi:UDP-glucose 4-epimerase
VSLRLFTVYGPGQRPDMAFHKFFKSIAEDKPITIFGDGKQTRDFTYIDDITAAFLAALRLGRQGETYNVGGGHREKLEDIFPALEDICQKAVRIHWTEEQKGDVLHTFADIEKAKKDFNYAPQTYLDRGLREEWDWIRKLYNF